MVRTLARTRPTATASSVQSKCDASRRSISTRLPLPARELLAGRRLVGGRRDLAFDLEEFFDDFFGQRRRRRAAVAALLDHYGDGDLGLIRRAVGNEPGVVADHVGQDLAL